MKKLISILLVAVMLVAMVPAMAFTTSAAEAPTVSWATDIDLTPFAAIAYDATASGRVQASDGKYYQADNISGKTFEIKTPQQLAGFAYLSNLYTGDCLKFGTIKITSDIDLGGKLWIPISMNGGSKFRGSIIGAKDGVEGASVKISNMYVDNSTTNNGNESGFIGQFGGDWIKNIDLVNATVKATNFTVGGFVGWQNGNVGSGLSYGKRRGGYENLTCDADIIVTSSRSDRYDCVGGIVGIINGIYDSIEGQEDTLFKNCVFTGTISAPNCDSVGGIIGRSEGSDGTSNGNTINGDAIEIDSCVVISEKMEWGRNNHYVTDNGGAHDTGFGGIAGGIYSNQAHEDVAFKVSNCYVAANMTILESAVSGKISQYVAGIVGTSCSQPKTIENCQFDGTIKGHAGSIGGILARNLENTTIKNCVVSGIAIRTDGDVSAIVGGGTGGLTVTDCFSSLKSVTGNGGATVTQISATTDYSALAADKWTKAEGDAAPILNVAADYVNENTPSVIKSGADFSWVTMADGMKISSVAQLDALEMVNAANSKAGDAIVAKTTVAYGVKPANLSDYAEKIQELVYGAIMADGTNVNEEIVTMAFAQKSVDVNDDGTYNVRVVAKIKGDQFTGVTFDFAVTRNNNGKTEYAEATTDVVTSCYTSVYQNVGGVAEAIEAGEGYYFVVWVFENVDLSYADTTFTVRANATPIEGEVVQSSATLYELN